MKNLISLLLFTLPVYICAQQLYDGTYTYSEEQIGLKVTFNIEDDGETMSSIKFIHKQDTLAGEGYWVQAPRYSDMEGGGWYESSLDDRIYLEMDIISDGEIKITETIDGNQVSVVVKSY